MLLIDGMEYVASGSLTNERMIRECAELFRRMTECIRSVGRGYVV